MANVSGLIEQLQAVIAEMQTLVEEENITEENAAKIEELENEARALQAQIDRAERFASNLAALKASLPRSAPKPAVEPAATEERSIAAPVETAVPRQAIRPIVATRNLRAFKGPNAEEAAYRSGMWIRGYLFNDSYCRRWCEDNGVLSRACNLTAQAGRVGGTELENPSLGGALVPDEMANTIIRLVEEYGAFPRYAQNVTMNSDVMIVPRRLSGLTAYAVNENCAPDPTETKFNQVKLVAGIWAVQNRCPNSLLEDSVINLADLIAQEAGYGIAVATDEAGFNGDGSPAANYVDGVCPAILGASHTASVSKATANSFDKLTMADFTTAMALLPQYAMANAAWYISPSGFAQSMVPLAMAVGGNTTREVADGPDKNFFLGFPVRTVTAMTSGAGEHGDKVACLFGDFGQACTYGNRRAVSIRTSSDRFMEYDQLLTYASARNAMVAHELGSTTAAGSLIALQFAAATP